MASISKAPRSGGASESKMPSDFMVPFQVSERVSVTANSAVASLAQKLPANARILWTQIRNNSAVSVASGTSGTGDPTGVGLLAGATATGTNTASTALVAVQTTTTDEALLSDAAFGYTGNETTSEVELHLLPARSALNGTDDPHYYNINSTPTNANHFDATADISVSVCGYRFPAIENV